MMDAPDLTLTAIKMIISLGVILIGIIAIYFVTKRLSVRSFQHRKGGYIDIIENKYIGVKKSLCLVRVPGSILVLGLSGDRINCLAEIDSEKEFVDKLQQRKLNPENRQKQNFKQYLAGVFPKKSEQ